MSRTKKTTLSKAVIFKTNRDELIKLLLNKIAFLNVLFYEKHSMDYRKKIKFTLEALENLLKIQKYSDLNLFGVDFESIENFIDKKIKNVIYNLN